MDQFEALYSAFAPECIAFGSDVLVPVGRASDFVGRCANISVAVIGIDYFLVSTGKRIPSDPINSVDLSSVLGKKSWIEIVEECSSSCVAAIEYELRANPNQYCVFTVMSRSEWEA